MQEKLIKNSIRFRNGIKHYDNSKCIISKYFEDDCEKVLNSIGTQWECVNDISENINSIDGLDIKTHFILREGYSPQTAVFAEFEVSNWSEENYVLIPGAVYNGNRFDVREIPYPPMFEDAKDIGVNVPTIITDVPRLSKDNEKSEIQLTTGDMATPSIGFYSPKSKTGFLLITNQKTDLGLNGISIRESKDKSQAVITITAPCMREENKYAHNTTKAVSDDRAADFNMGDVVELDMKVFIFACESVQGLFDRYSDERKSIDFKTSRVNSIPFSEAWKIQEERYNRECWDEERGFYAGGMGDGNGLNWQIGWVGGGMSTHALITQGDALSRDRSIKTIDFMFSSQTESGFFHGCNYDGMWVGDGLDRKHAETWHLIRKSSDALYFIMKQIMLLERQDDFWEIPKHWMEGTKRLADAFVHLWNKYGQYGQFIDVYTGEIMVGGSTSAGIAPAGLALASDYFHNESYLKCAIESADYFYEQHVKNGVTTGGPGEILQGPDSESAFALLESFMVLHEVTGNNRWITSAKEMANQCMTWCVSYDYEWPDQSEFGRLDMKTTGSVIANVQNKHSSPGICTLSGDSLFKLYRATGEMKYLELIQDIAHCLPQFMSRNDRPITSWNNQRPLPAGWICERVNMSDWEGKDKIGGVFYGSTWSEVANMLTYTEIPGIYVQTDIGHICVFDHVEANIVENNEQELLIRVSNPTRFHSVVKVFYENSNDMKKVLGQNGLLGCEEVKLLPGEEAIIKHVKKADVMNVLPV